MTYRSWFLSGIIFICSLTLSVSSWAQTRPPSPVSELRVRAEEAVRLLRAEREVVVARLLRIQSLRQQIQRLSAESTRRASPQALEIQRETQALAAVLQKIERAETEARILREAQPFLLNFQPTDLNQRGARYSPTIWLRFATQNLLLYARPHDNSAVASVSRGSPVMLLMSDATSSWRLGFAAGRLAFLIDAGLSENPPR